MKVDASFNSTMVMPRIAEVAFSRLTGPPIGGSSAEKEFPPRTVYLD
jgi:hypothetical protein